MCAKAHRLDFYHMLSVQVQPYLNKNTVLFIYKGNRTGNSSQFIVKN